MYNFNLNFIPMHKGVFIVGGSVRDAMLGLTPKDYDIAVIGDAGAVAKEIGARVGSRVIQIGKDEKMIHRVVSNDKTIDISPVKDRRIEKDLECRDFTINAMAFDVYEKKIIDPLNGKSDLNAGIVRMVSPMAFQRDPIRMLRAYRIAAILKFGISAGTLKEIRKNASDIKNVAGERIREEWIKLLATSDSFEHLLKLEEAGLLRALFPELKPLKHCVQNEHHTLDVFDHSLVTYRSLENLLNRNTPRLSDHYDNRELVSDIPGYPLIKHAALFHDVGKPVVRSVDEKEKIHFYDHETEGSRITERISDRLRFSTAQKNYVSFIVQHHLRPLFLFLAHSGKKAKSLTYTKFFRTTQPYTTDMLLFFTADTMGKQKHQKTEDAVSFARSTVEIYFNYFYPESKRPPLITGTDLIHHFNLTPSAVFAEILDKIELQRLAGNIRNRKEAFQFATNLLKNKNML